MDGLSTLNFQLSNPFRQDEQDEQDGMGGGLQDKSRSRIVSFRILQFLPVEYDRAFF